jgi:hypothetical protein
MNKRTISLYWNTLHKHYEADSEGLRNSGWGDTQHEAVGRLIMANADQLGLKIDRSQLDEAAIAYEQRANRRAELVANRTV